MCVQADVMEHDNKQLEAGPLPSAAVMVDTSVVTPERVSFGPWRTIPGHPSARTRILEPHPPGGVLGLLYLDTGTTVPASRGDGQTWLWVLKGRCRLSGRSLETGAYAWIPSEDRQELDVPPLAPRGCLLLYLTTAGTADRGPSAS
jgi:hypothetical protein